MNSNNGSGMATVDEIGLRLPEVFFSASKRVELVGRRFSGLPLLFGAERHGHRRDAATWRGGQFFGSKFMIANVIASTPVLMVGSGTGANRGE
jgi:hypothetical protein